MNQIITKKSQTFKQLKKILAPTNKTNEYIVYGANIIKEAFEKKVVKELYGTEKSELTKIYPNFKLVEKSVIKEITQSNSAEEFAVLLKDEKELNLDENMLIIDGVQDPGNMGTIIRTARAYGIKQVLLGEGSVSLYNLKVQRSIQGVHLGMTFKKANVYAFLKEYPHQIITTFVDQKNDTQQKVKAPFGLVVGNEGQGIQKRIADLEHINRKINLEIESLNVGVATGIIIDRIVKEIYE